MYLESLEYSALISSLEDIEFKPDFENEAYSKEEIDIPKTLPEEWEKDDSELI